MSATGGGRAIIVLGMHRSGTSAVARGLKTLGVELGDRLMPPHAEDNPKGYWEDLDIVELNERVLKAAGPSSWQSVRPITPDAWASALQQGLMTEAVGLIRTRFGGCRLWGFKDPRTTRLLPFWKEVLQRVGAEDNYVIVVRNPVSVARSLAGRNSMPAELSHLLWLEHMLPAIGETSGKRRVVVDFDALMEAPAKQLARIAAALDLPSDGKVRGEIDAFARDFLDQGLRHTVYSPDDVRSDPSMMRMTGRVFQRLHELSRDAITFDDERLIEDMREVEREFESVGPLCRLIDDREAALELLRQDISRVKQSFAVVRQEFSETLQELAAGRRLLAEAHDTVRKVTGSRSWLLTAPLRQAGKVLRKSRALQRRETSSSEQLRFPETAAPEVSIIIPVCGGIESTHRCLKSIHDAMPQRSFEILIVDDGVRKATAKLPAGIIGVRPIRHGEHPGTLHARNTAARSARGRYLLFLNSDTQVKQGWLDELAGTLEQHPDAGLVGSMLLSPDGRIQEAGGIIRSDGSVGTYGRNDDADKPDYNYLREVDCCSGASFLVRADLFREVGGFDERYTPDSYEDVDLACELHRRGRKVLYQPLSRVVLHEGASPGGSASSGSATFAAGNRHAFLDKWREVIARNGEPAAPVRAAGERRIRKRLLVVDATTPTPDQDAGSVDVLSYLSIFRSLSYGITFIPEDNYARRGSYTLALQRMGVECLYAPYVTSLRDHLREQGDRYDIVMLYRAPTAARHIDDVRTWCPQAAVIFNTVDLHYLRQERQAAIEGSDERRKQAAAMKAAELSVIARADCTIVLNSAEQELLQRETAVRGKHIAVMPLIIPVPGRSAPFAERRDIVFIGGYQHQPNTDAVAYFVRHVWPLIAPRIPGCRFVAVGSNPPPEILSLQGEGVVIAGYVEDLDPVFARCRLSVAPIRYGAGMKGKVLTSMSYGVPCVATAMAVEGGDYRNGENVLVADDPQAFADAVIRLYHDEPLWDRLSKNGLLFVERNYSLAAGRARIEDLLRQLPTA